MKGIYLPILLGFIWAIFQSLSAQKATQPSAPTRISVRPTEHDRLYNRTTTLRLKQATLNEALAELSKEVKLSFEADPSLEGRSRKLMLACSEDSPAKVLVAIAEAYGGEWHRQKKGFRLLPKGQGGDQAESVLSRVEAALSRMASDSDQSNLSPDELHLISSIRSTLDMRRQNPPWTQDALINSVLYRKEKEGTLNGLEGPYVSWRVSSRREGRVGDLNMGGVSGRWWNVRKR